ncbi:YidB family protein [Methylopila sp. M107]|uniref:YidB family protein n=1 Tax=Methylopila sp. M107 TaxID=1101190 RepID=UPI00047846C0|nr:YidB family protein [Methylopila sp. M107]
MSWLDQVKGSLGGESASGFLERLIPGGLQAVLDQLQNSGLGQQARSWLGKGPNEPITVEDLRTALSNEQVRAVATKLGVPIDQALEILAGRLPGAVDEASPDGELRTPPPEKPAA